MKNDFVKSIMDSSYNKVVGAGKEIGLFDVLLKYCYQYQHEQMIGHEVWAEDVGKTKEQMLKYQDWVNDGKPTGIESDKQFYELQKRAYGEIIMELDDVLGM